jgi:hypothetical protein
MAHRAVNAIAHRVPNISQETVPESGSPALSMIQALQKDEISSICRGFAVGLGQKRAVITENAGEP